MLLSPLYFGTIIAYCTELGGGFIDKCASHSGT